MKTIVITVIVLLAVGVATLPVWGGCDLNTRACRTWCAVRHFNSENDALVCKARCASEGLRCEAKAGARNVRDLINSVGK